MIVGLGIVSPASALSHITIPSTYISSQELMLWRMPFLSFRLGFTGSKDTPGTEPGKPYVNNHLRFIVKYHKWAQPSLRELPGGKS